MTEGEFYDDLTFLRDLSVPSILGTLKHRYQQGEFYTNVSSIVLFFNSSDEQKEQKAPIKLIDQAVQGLKSRPFRQSIILNGVAESGKTEMVTLILKHLRQSGQAPEIEDKIVQVQPLINAFGSAKTEQNSNSSRVGRLVQVYFDSNLQIAGGHTTHFFPESSRVVQQGGWNFNFFYQICAGAKDCKYHLDSPFAYLRDQERSRDKDAADFEATMAAMDQLQFAPGLKKRIISTAAAILHLGNIQFNPETGNIEGDSLQRTSWVAALLEVKTEELELQLTRDARGQQKRGNKAQLDRDAFAKYLYEMCFNVVVLQCNEATRTLDVTRALSIVDLPGFEARDCNGFDQLIINYSHDCLQRIVEQQMFEALRDCPDEKWDVPLNLTPYDPGFVEKDLFPTIASFLAVSDENKEPQELKALLAPKGLRFSEDSGSFRVSHFAGEVSYTANGFCEAAHTVVPKGLEALGRVVVQSMNTFQCGDVEIAFPSFNVSRDVSKFKGVLRELQFAQPHHLFCILPSTKNTVPRPFEEEFVQKQLEAFRISEIAQIQKVGYVYGMDFKRFYNRYKILSYRQAENDSVQSSLALKEGCKALLERLKTDVFVTIERFQPDPRYRDGVDKGWVIGSTKVWTTKHFREWLEVRLEFLKLQEAQRQLLEECVREKNTNKMMEVINEAGAFFPPNDCKIEEAKLLYGDLCGIVQDLVEHMKHLGSLEDREGISYETQVIVNNDIARARAAGLSEQVGIVQALKIQLGALMTEERELEIELHEQNYDRIEGALALMRGKCNRDLEKRAECWLQSVRPILEELKKASKNDIPRAIRLIARADYLRIVSDQLSKSRDEVRGALLRQIRGYKTPETKVEQKHLDEIDALLAIKELFPLLCKPGDTREFREIEERSIALEEAKRRIWLRLELANAIQEKPFDIAKATSFLKKLADVPRKERFEGDEVAAARREIERHKTQFKEADMALNLAISGRHIQKIREVLEENASILPQEVKDEAYQARNKFALLERHLRELLALEDVDKIDEQLEKCPENWAGPADLLYALQLPDVRTLFQKIKTAWLSRNIEHLSAAINEANEAKLGHTSRVREAEVQLKELNAAARALKEAVDKKEVEEMKAAFQNALDLGVSGELFDGVCADYFECIKRTTQAQAIAVQQLKAELRKARNNYDCDRLEALLDFARNQGFDDQANWQRLHPTCDHFEDFRAEYEESLRTCSEIRSKIANLSNSMESGDVNGLRNILSTLPPHTRYPPSRQEILNAFAYSRDVARFEFHHKLALESKLSDLDELSRLHAEATRLNLRVSIDIQVQISQRKQTLDAFRESTTDWFTNLPKFLNTVLARSTDLPSMVRTEAEALARQAITNQLEVAFAQALAAQVADINAERQLKIAVLLADSEDLEALEKEPAIDDDDLKELLCTRAAGGDKEEKKGTEFYTLLADARSLKDLLADTRRLEAAVQRRDIEGASRWASEARDRLRHFPYQMADFDSFIHSAYTWQAEAKGLQEDLEKYVTSKQADLLLNAVDRGQLILPLDEQYKKACEISQKLQLEVRELRHLANMASEPRLIECVAESKLHPNVRALQLAKHKLSELAAPISVTVLEKAGNFESFEKCLALGKMYHPALESLRQWTEELTRIVVKGDMEELRKCLAKHKGWYSDARSRAVQWAQDTLGTRLNHLVALASQQLREESVSSKLHSTMARLRDASESARRWIQEEELKSLLPSVNDAEDQNTALGLKWRVKTSMSSMDEDSLKLALIEYDNKFRNETYGWLREARKFVEKIDIARNQLKSAIAFQDETKLGSAIAYATQGKGEHWPEGAPILPDDPTLTEAHRLQQKLDTGGDLIHLRTALIDHNVKQESNTPLGTATSFRLADIPVIWHAVVSLLPETKIDQQLTRGTHAALGVLCDLYHMDDPKWREVRDFVRVGLIKETKDYGNTSVSMGLAVKYFEKYPKKEFVGFMNCGTAGVKYQFYAKKRFIVTLGEYKPSQSDKSDPATFAKLPFGTFKPSKGPFVTVDSLHRTMVLELAEAPWNKIADLVNAEVEVFAFVTGSLRNHYEKLYAEEKTSEPLEILREVTKAFASGEKLLARPVSDIIDFDFPGKRGEGTSEGKESGSYLLPQDLEARMEFVASVTLYKQAYQARPKGGKNEELEPIFSIGIGVASAQVHQPGTQPLKYVGMEKAEVVFIGESIAEAFCTEEGRLAKLIGAIEDCKTRDTLPTIALKSGCLLALSKTRHPAHKLFTQAIEMKVTPKPDETIRVYASRSGNSERIPMSVRLQSTLPELCAQAAIQFRRMGHRKVQFVQAVDASSRRAIVVVTRDLENAHIQFGEVLGGLQDYAVSSVQRKRITYFEDLNEYIVTQYPEWSNSTTRTSAQIVPCIPLCWFPDKWHALKPKLDNFSDLEEKGRIMGTHAALLTLKDMNFISDETWANCLKHVQVGIIKSTFDSGNASGSMGLAVKYFGKSKHRIVGFLSCHTGGMKFQLYTNLPHRDSQTSPVALVAELKRGAKLSFSNLELEACCYKPDSQRAIGLEKFQERLQKWLKRVPWTSASWPTGKVPIFAFITGGLRQHWENMEHLDQKEELSAIVNRLFHPTGEENEVLPVSQLLDPSEPPCYFITKAVQNVVEQVAVDTMYKQLNSAFEPVAVLAIRRRDSKFTIITERKEGKIADVGFGLPGNERPDVLTLGSKIVKGFREAPAGETGTCLAAFTKVCMSAIEAGKQPLITLKSASLLMIDQIREFLSTRPPCNEIGDNWGPLPMLSSRRIVHLAPPNRRTQIGALLHQLAKRPNFPWDVPFSIGSIEPSEEQVIQMTISLPITSARLCAMAANAYGLPIDFYQVFQQFEDPSTRVPKLVKLKEVIRGKDLKRAAILYLFPIDSSEETNEVHLAAPAGEIRERDHLTEFIVRAQRIFPRNDSIVEEVAKDHFGYAESRIRHHLEWLSLNPDEATRVMRPFLDPPKRPPSGSASSLRPRAVIDSFVEKLPLGQFMCPEQTLYHAVAHQLEALGIDPKNGGARHSAKTVEADITQFRGMGRRELENDTNQWALECKAIPELYRSVTLHVVRANSTSEPCVFGNGVHHVWLFWNNNWASLWSPPSSSIPDGPDVLQLLSCLLNEESDSLDLSPLTAFAQLWVRIAADDTILTEVNTTIRDMASRYIETCLHEQARIESIVLDAFPTFHSPDQLGGFIHNLRDSLVLCDAPGFTDVVCESFGGSLLLCWEQGYGTATPHEAWEWNELFKLLKEKMTRPRYLALVAANHGGILAQFEAAESRSSGDVVFHA